MADDEVPLREALRQYRALVTYASSYDSYREEATRSGMVWLGVMLPVRKDSRGWWVVLRADLVLGLDAERQRQQRKTQAEEAYQRHVLYGGDGELINTDTGAYEKRGDFHVWYDPHYPRWQAKGRSWICNACWRQADEEHGYDYCLRCDDGKECRSDCTLSGVSCETCGVRQEILFDSNLYRAPGTAPDRHAP